MRWLCLFGFGVVMVVCGWLVGLWCVLFVTGRCSLFGAAYRGLRAYVCLVMICCIFWGVVFRFAGLVLRCGVWWLGGSGLGVLGGSGFLAFVLSGGLWIGDYLVIGVFGLFRLFLVASWFFVLAWVWCNIVLRWGCFPVFYSVFTVCA